MIARRRGDPDRYAAALAQVPGVQILARTDGVDDSGDNHWLTCITLPSGVSPDGVVADLNALNIEARHLWKPMHLQPVHRSRRAFVTGTSEQLVPKRAGPAERVGL